MPIYLWSVVEKRVKRQKPLKGKKAIFATLRKNEIIREILDHGDSIIPYLAQEFGMNESVLRDEIAKIRLQKGI